MEIGEWLRSLGLEKYEAVFRDNEIEADVLPELTELDLEKLGLPLGPRKRLLKAIATLAAEQKLAVSSGPPRVRPDVAERRQVTVMFSDLAHDPAFQCLSRSDQVANDDKAGRYADTGLQRNRCFQCGYGRDQF